MDPRGDGHVSRGRRNRGEEASGRGIRGRAGDAGGTGAERRRRRARGPHRWCPRGCRWKVSWSGPASDVDVREPPETETPPGPRMVTALSVSYWWIAAVSLSATSWTVSAPVKSTVADGPVPKEKEHWPSVTPRAAAAEIRDLGVAGEARVEVGGALEACGEFADGVVAAEGDGDLVAEVEVGEEAGAAADIAIAEARGDEGRRIGRGAAEDMTPRVSRLPMSVSWRIIESMTTAWVRLVSASEVTPIWLEAIDLAWRTRSVASPREESRRLRVLSASPRLLMHCWERSRRSSRSPMAEARTASSLGFCTSLPEAILETGSWAIWLCTWPG